MARGRKAEDYGEASLRLLPARTGNIAGNPPPLFQKMWFLMRKVKSDWAAGDIYLSSPAPASVPVGYHKIWGAVRALRHHRMAVTIPRSCDRST
jgi:hypothetical protein